jgi:hypothetical protein
LMQVSLMTIDMGRLLSGRQTAIPNPRCDDAKTSAVAALSPDRRRPC